MEETAKLFEVCGRLAALMALAEEAQQQGASVQLGRIRAKYQQECSELVVWAEELAATEVRCQAQMVRALLELRRELGLAAA